MVHKCLTGTIFILLLLTGCMYPSENLSKNQIANDAQLQMVQQAIDQYAAQNNGLLPIFTKESDTPIYQKYIIDFSLLKQQGLLQTIPGTAFENGGSYQYVLIDVETNPTVKVIDLRIAEEIRIVQQRLNVYRSEHVYPPFGEKVANSVYKLDEQELNLDEDPYIKSPYSDKNLPIYIDTDGQLTIDYRMELYPLLENEEHSYKEGEDIRSIITDHHAVVPAYSVPYTIKNDEPVFAPELNE
ncbi:hypothetical protein [Gracilibacillus sp. YIM 98692]|uniref:hypothetical protein n=1 Tax=Gracilibacillus sp. YIM 98692 TaxID=2663532 RepID=UPI0013D7CC87|nr:hypothetical protein [Gracilibacillus sp. YIM 98692]